MRAFFSAHRWCLLAVFSQGGRFQLSAASLLRPLILFLKAETSWLNYPSKKPHLLILSDGGFGFCPEIGRKINVQTLSHSKSYCYLYFIDDEAGLFCSVICPKFYSKYKRFWRLNHTFWPECLLALLYTLLFPPNIVWWIIKYYFIVVFLCHITCALICHHSRVTMMRLFFISFHINCFYLREKSLFLLEPAV